MAQRYYLDGYQPPSGIQDREGVIAMQRQLGVTVDGIWGPKTEAAYRARNSKSTTQISSVTGLAPQESGAVSNIAFYTPARSF